MPCARIHRFFYVLLLFSISSSPWDFCEIVLFSYAWVLRFRGMSVSIGGVVLEPVLAHQSLLWLSLLLSWLAPRFSCLRVRLLFW